METEIFKSLLDQGPTTTLLALVTFMFFKFLKKYIQNSEAQTKVVTLNSEVIRQCTDAIKSNNESLKKNNEVMEKVEKALRKNKKVEL